MNKIFDYLDPSSKAFRCPLRGLVRGTFCDQKVPKKSPATSPPQQKPLGFPVVLRFAGGRKTRFAQTVATLFPANLPLLGGSQAHQRQKQNQKQHPGCRSLLAGEWLLRSDCQQCLVFKPLILDEASAGTQKQKRKRKPNSTSSVHTLTNLEGVSDRVLTLILKFMSLAAAEERKRWRTEGRNCLSAASFAAADSVEYRRASGPTGRTANSATAFLDTFFAKKVSRISSRSERRNAFDFSFYGSNSKAWVI